MSETNANTAPVPDTATNAANAVEAAKGPSPETVAAIAAKLSNIPPTLYNPTEVSFGFRGIEVVPKQLDDKGKPVKTRRPTVKLALPLPTIEGIIEVITGGEAKEAERARLWLVSLVSDQVIAAARAQVSPEDSDEKEVNTQDELDYSKLTLAYLTAQPLGDRRGGGIDKATWEAFGKDYIETMLTLGGDAKKIGRQIDYLGKKFAPIKTNKPVIKKLVSFLDTYILKTANAEDFAECVDVLKKKAETLLSADDAALVELI